MHKRTSFYLKTNEILYKNQYGFEKPTVQLIQLLHLLDTATCLDEKESVMAVLLDLSKAFNTIDHNILLKNRNFMDLEGKRWIGSGVI